MSKWKLGMLTNRLIILFAMRYRAIVLEEISWRGVVSAQEAPSRLLALLRLCTSYCFEHHSLGPNIGGQIRNDLEMSCSPQAMVLDL